MDLVERKRRPKKVNKDTTPKGGRLLSKNSLLNKNRQDNKGNKPSMIKKKPVPFKPNGNRGKSFGGNAMDSEDENDYPFDDGIKCTIF